LREQWAGNQCGKRERRFGSESLKKSIEELRNLAFFADKSASPK